MTVDSVRLCAGSLLVEQPEELLLDYLDVRNGYAYPSYDRLVTNGSAELVDGDLLAPALIGTEVDRGRFRLLRELMPRLAGVADVPSVGLDEADDPVVERVAELFAVLDEAPYAGRGRREVARKGQGTAAPCRRLREQANRPRGHRIGASRK